MGGRSISSSATPARKTARQVENTLLTVFDDRAFNRI